MTAALPPRAADARSAVSPPDGALVRLTVDHDWTAFPPAPAGTDITVSFSCAAAAAAAPQLAALGYRCVGLAPASASSRPVADFLVPQALLDQHRPWWRAMTGRAEGIFGLAFGPPHVALRDVLRVHRQPVR